MWLVFLCFGYVMLILEVARWLTWFFCVPLCVIVLSVADLCVRSVLAMLSGAVALIVAMFRFIVSPKSTQPPPPPTSAFASSPDAVPTAFAADEIKGGPPAFMVAQEVHAIV